MEARIIENKRVEVFEPITIEFTIESKEELLELYARLRAFPSQFDSTYSGLKDITKHSTSLDSLVFEQMMNNN
jgi:hypothetical protein